MKMKNKKIPNRHKSSELLNKIFKIFSITEKRKTEKAFYFIRLYTYDTKNNKPISKLKLPLNI